MCSQVGGRDQHPRTILGSVELPSIHGNGESRAQLALLLSQNKPGPAVDERVDSKAQAEQLRSVTVERIGPVLGRVPAQVMAEVDDALRLHLQL
jgi:mRNA-degrading endonuclease toxin of MazEF toxin-antitoxin module